MSSLLLKLINNLPDLYKLPGKDFFCLKVVLDNKKKYKLCTWPSRIKYKYVVGQYVLQIKQIFKEAIEYCEKHNASMLYPGDRTTSLPNNMSSIWLNMKKMSFQHLTWIDNTSLGKCSAWSLLNILVGLQFIYQQHIL